MLRFDALFEQPPPEFFETSAEAAHILGQALCFVLAGEPAADVRCTKLHCNAAAAGIGHVYRRALAEAVKLAAELRAAALNYAAVSDKAVAHLLHNLVNAAVYVRLLLGVLNFSFKLSAQRFQPLDCSPLQRDSLRIPSEFAAERVIPRREPVELYAVLPAELLVFPAALLQRRDCQRAEIRQFVGAVQLCQALPDLCLLYTSPSPRD